MYSSRISPISLILYIVWLVSPVVSDFDFEPRRPRSSLRLGQCGMPLGKIWQTVSAPLKMLLIGVT